MFPCFNYIFGSSVSDMIKEDSELCSTMTTVCIQQSKTDMDMNAIKFSLSMSVSIAFHCVYFIVCVDVSLTQFKVG